jgi:hypothetical protein
LVSAPIFAGEVEGKSAALDISNIGFMDNPPKALKEKFPMCDAFLKVKWIDEQKKIGYSHFDFFVDGKKEGQMTALVYLSPHLTSLAMDLYQYQRNGTLQSIFSFIKAGKIVGLDFPLTISNGHKQMAFYPAKRDFTLSDGRQIDCVLYPDGQTAWIAETKEIGKIYSDQEIEKKYEDVKHFLPELSLDWFKTSVVMDFNFDGNEEYYFFGPQIVYSLNDKYFSTRKIRAGYDYVEYNFPTTTKTCGFSPPAPLTTDGKSYFLGNQCNLTEVTKGGE